MSLTEKLLCESEARLEEQLSVVDAAVVTMITLVNSLIVACSYQSCVSNITQEDTCYDVGGTGERGDAGDDEEC